MRVGAIEVFRTERNNNLDARSALRRSPLDRRDRVSQPVKLRHKVSHSVTIVTLACCRQTIQISSCAIWAN